jgi:hypothetical protein
MGRASTFGRFLPVVVGRSRPKAANRNRLESTVDSTGRRNGLAKAFSGRIEVECFSRSLVQSSS